MIVAKTDHVLPVYRLRAPVRRSCEKHEAWLRVLPGTERTARVQTNNARANTIQRLGPPRQQPRPF